MTTITEKKDHWLDVLFRDRVEFPGNEGILLPRGSNLQRPTTPKVENGYLRYNTDTQDFEGYKNGAWTPISTGASTVGEVNDGINVGSAPGEIFRDKTGVDFNFRTIRAGSPMITVTIGGGGDEIIIDSMAASLFLPLAGGSMNGDIQMLVGAQLLMDPTANPPNCAVGFLTDAGTGFFQGTLSFGHLGISNGGTHSWTFDSAGHFVPAMDGAVNIGNTLTYVGDTYSERFIGRDGSDSDPTFTFGAATGTGMYRDPIGHITWAIGGTDRWRINTAGHLEPASVGYDVGASGTPVRNFWGRYYLGDPAFSGPTSPTFSFIGDIQTGMYAPAAAELGWVIGGDIAFRVEADGTLVVPATTAGGNNYEDQVTADDDIPNKRYVDDAIVAGAAQDYEQTFTDGSPEMGASVADHLDVNHNLNQEWPTVAVWDDNRRIVYPGIESVDANNIRIDFSGGWRPLSGTWHVKVVG